MCLISVILLPSTNSIIIVEYKGFGGDSTVSCFFRYRTTHFAIDTT